MFNGRKVSLVALNHMLFGILQFIKFAEYLRKESSIRVNAIQSIENGCNATGMGLKPVYEEEALPKVYNRYCFKIFFFNTFIATDDCCRV